MYDSLVLTIECEDGYFVKHQSAIIDEGAIIGANSKIWAGARIFSGAKLGKNCVIGAGVHIESGVQLGNNCKVQRGVTLYSGVKAKDYVFFGPSSITTNDLNPRAFGPWEITETNIDIGASIGAGAVLVCGNDIGKFALVGAGSVVTKPVEDCRLVVGNPAKPVGWVGIDGRVISKNNERPTEIDGILANPSAVITNYLRVGNA